MLAAPVSHSKFCLDFDTFCQSLSPSDFSRLSSDPDYANALFKIAALNFDSVIPLLQNFYDPARGRLAKSQIEIFRSLFLMFHFKCTSPSIWHSRLQADPLLQALSGFFDGHIPALGSFYNFIHRITGTCFSRDDYQFPPGLFSKENLKKIKEQKKLKKEKKWENVPKGAVQQLVDSIEDGSYDSENEIDILNSIFSSLTWNQGIERGLIPSSGIVLDGDGTALPIHSNPQGHSVHGDHSSPIRSYSDPDANIGWDSHEERWYFGYSCYFICIKNPYNKLEVPVFFQLSKASRHDSLSGVEALYSFKRIHPNSNLRAVCLDSANDNTATHNFCKFLDIIPVIDLNPRSSRKVAEKFDTSGNLICQGSLPMHNCGFDKTKGADKYRCPIMYKRDGYTECPCKEGPCTNSAYGRVIYDYNADPRMAVPAEMGCPRGSSLWKSLYKQRTSCERVNNRVLNDYKLQTSKAKRSPRVRFFLLLICLNIHVDSWHKLEFNKIEK